MSRRVVVSFAILLIVIPLVLAKGGKYSKEKNKMKDETELRQSADDRDRKSSGHFRVAKLDAVWERAQRHLNIDDRRDIFEELQDLDQDEITLKRLRHDGGDKNGDITAKLRDRLHDLLEKYDLLTPLHDKRDSVNAGSKQGSVKPKKASKTDTSTLELLFADKKLNKLWAKAQKTGFSAEELATLKTEFDHHQQKLDQYRDFGGEIEGLGRTDLKDVNRFQNLADELSHEERKDESAGASAQHTTDRVKLDAGIKDIIKNYGVLKAKVNRNAFVPDNGDFKEGRVEDLWKQAMEAGFDRDELLSLREELSHFERKLSKLKNFRDGAGNLTGKNQRDAQVKDSEKSEEHADLEQKVKHYAVKVENIHSDIERRINSRHNEL